MPIHLGCQRPLVLPWVSAENVHGDGSGGLDMDFAGTVTEDEHGVDALIRLTAESPGEISIVAIGPLTNIAMAAVKDPDFVRNVKSLVIMGGSNNGRGNITAAGEFNFYVDPHAAHVVFEAGFRDITVVPWAPLTLRDAVFSREQLAGIEAIGTPLARFLPHRVRPHPGVRRERRDPGHDPPRLALSRSPAAPRARDDSPPTTTWQSRWSRTLTRGYSAMSWGVHGLEPNARVVESADAAASTPWITGQLLETRPR